MIGELTESARRSLGEAPAPAASAGLPGDMGWLMADVPEAQGGLGLGLGALAAIGKELGRALVPGPALAQFGVVAALAQAPAFDGRDALLEAAMGGEVVTASLATDAGSATLTCVPDADRANRVLVFRPNRAALVALDAAGVSVIERPTWDRTRRLFDVMVPHDAPATVLTEGVTAQALDCTVRATMLFLLAADSLGGAEAALDLTVEYLKTRRQFDRPLAMFQALKHRAADLKCAIAAADALLGSVAAGDALGLDAAGALKAHACAVYRAVTEEAIQLHGGIGLTMEHRCHLFLKRAMLNAALLGDADHWDAASGRSLLAKADQR